MNITIDCPSAISIHQQLVGAIMRVVVFGALTAGVLLSRVRDLAAVAGVAPRTVSHARALERHMRHMATVEPTRIGRPSAGVPLHARSAALDLVPGFRTLANDICRLFPHAKVQSLWFIPSENARLVLAFFNPIAKTAVVSRFADFLAILTLGVRRFATHLQCDTATAIDDPAMPAECNVLIHSPGAEPAAQSAPREHPMECRHIPDPGDRNRLVIPIITKAARFAQADRKEAS